MSKIPLIIDCDPGTDDAVAILMAQGCGLFDIKAICPVNGNSPLSETKKNALNLAQYLGIKTRVAIGANEPIFKIETTNSNFKRNAELFKRDDADENFQAGNSMFKFPFPTPTFGFDEKPAWDVIYEEAVKANG